MVDLRDFESDGLNDIVTHKLEVRMRKERSDVSPLTRVEVVKTDDFVAFVQKPFTKMCTNKAGPAGNENPFGHR